MWFLLLLSWLSNCIHLAFIVLAVAAGLYYLAEFVEEYTVLSSKIIYYVILITICIYACLLIFESFPLWMVLFGLFAQASHLCLLKNFPYFQFNSPSFISGVSLFVVNHYYAFTYFSNEYTPFNQIIGYFTLCLWLVPFSFFISLSANDHVLPMHSETRPLLSEQNDVVSYYLNRKVKKSGLLAFFNYAKETLLPEKMKKSF